MWDKNLAGEYALLVKGKGMCLDCWRMGELPLGFLRRMEGNYVAIAVRSRALNYRERKDETERGCKIQVRLEYTDNRDKGILEDRNLLLDVVDAGRREGRC